MATPRKSPSASHSSTPIQRLSSPSSDSCCSQPNASSPSDLSNIDNGIEVISYQDWLNSEPDLEFPGDISDRDSARDKSGDNSFIHELMDNITEAKNALTPQKLKMH